MEMSKWRGNPTLTTIYADAMHHQNLFALSSEILISSNRLNLRRIAAINAMYRLLDDDLKAYKQAVIRKELEIPFFDKLYQLCGREV